MIVRKLKFESKTLLLRFLPLFDLKVKPLAKMEIYYKFIKFYIDRLICIKYTVQKKNLIMPVSCSVQSGQLITILQEYVIKDFQWVSKIIRLRS